MDTTPRDTTPRDGTPRDATPRDTTSRDSAPREASSRDGTPRDAAPRVGLLMGSRSDWPTLTHCSAILTSLEIPHTAHVVSAHRTPAWLTEYATSAEGRGLRVLIAAAGGAAHLPGMTAAQTLLPVLGVPIRSPALDGLDSLLSIAQMPAGVPVLTLPIGEAGAIGAAWLAARILAQGDVALAARLLARG